MTRWRTCRLSSELTELANLAGAGWGGFDEEPAQVSLRENAVFFTRLSDARPVALRLHRDGYQSDAAIIEELAICEMLADAGFACPWPYRTDTDGFLYHLPDGKNRATVVQWIDAPPLSDTSLEDRPTADRYAAIGALLADLHLTADTVLPPPTARPSWDMDCLTGGQPLWGDCVQDPALSTEANALIAQARAAAKDRLAKIPTKETGLIHGDALPENILDRKGTLYLIDFDDCGHGYRLYDLATALIGEQDDDRRAEAAEALRDSYLAAGGPLAAGAFVDLPLFLMLRAHASAAWAMTRCAPGDTRITAYRVRSLALTRSYLANL